MTKLSEVEQMEILKHRPVLKISEAAMWSGIPEGTLYKALEAGQIKRLFPPPHDARIHREDLDSFIATLRM